MGIRDQVERTVLYSKSVFSAFVQGLENFLSRLKRDNALQNCEYINIVRIPESLFFASIFVISDIGDPHMYFLLSVD